MHATQHHAQVIRACHNVERSADGSWNFAADSHDDVANGGVDGVVSGVEDNAGVVFDFVFKVAKGEGEAVSAPQFALQQGRGLGCSSKRCGMNRT